MTTLFSLRISENLLLRLKKIRSHFCPFFLCFLPSKPVLSRPEKDFLAEYIRDRRLRPAITADAGHEFLIWNFIWKLSVQYLKFEVVEQMY
ncbi:hypothetical protein [Roseibium sp.]|uniref:hypothetical protein n=1 Tax=Roseibium sp. TaxID=1936156 RepID=UPI003D130E75